MENEPKPLKRRDRHGRFLPGAAPGPGRPKGITTEQRLALKALHMAEKRLEDLAGRAIDVLQQQMEGDVR